MSLPTIPGFYAVKEINGTDSYYELQPDGMWWLIGTRIKRTVDEMMSVLETSGENPDIFKRMAVTTPKQDEQAAEIVRLNRDLEATQRHYDEVLDERTKLTGVVYDIQKLIDAATPELAD